MYEIVGQMNAVNPTIFSIKVNDEDRKSYEKFGDNIEDEGGISYEISAKV